jgi:hypothetical protein
VRIQMVYICECSCNVNWDLEVFLWKRFMVFSCFETDIKIVPDNSCGLSFQWVFWSLFEFF